MQTSTFILLALALVLFVLVVLRNPSGLGPAMQAARNQILVFGVKLPLALLSAAFISISMPPALVSPYIGPDSGGMGILLATAFGALVPGGPMLTFPLALVIWRGGAGDAQMVTFLASWSIFAVHRVIAYELPILGGRFVLTRLASSWMLPPLAGAVAVVLLVLFG